MAQIRVIVRSNEPSVSWQEALKFPPRTIFLDDACKGPTRFDEKRKIWNFNHHDGVDRYSTLSTSAQVLDAIRLKITRLLRNEQEQLDFTIVVNDSDQDVCLAVFLLMNAYLVESTNVVPINRLVYMEDKLDVTAGSYPFHHDMEMLEVIRWIFEPYTHARNKGLLHGNDPDIHRQVIESVGERIMKYTFGKAERLPVDTRYEVLSSGSSYTMVQEIGQDARFGMYRNGIEAYITVKERTDGSYQYVIGRISPYIPFPIEKIFKRLNELEGLTAKNGWGGGNVVGGSPRVNGSRLSPDAVKQAVDDVISGKAKARLRVV